MAAEDALIEMAYARALPIVATNPANFVEPNFHAAHDAMLCIAQSAYVESEDRRVSSPEAWQIGRASCRERVCQYVSISLVAGSLKKKKYNRINTNATTTQKQR